VRRTDADEGDELERILPVGESKRRVWSWGEALLARKVESRFVRSMVWDIGWSDVGEEGWE
jgi:hypothetical protein